MNGLHVDSVRLRLGGREILNDIFLSCTPGQIVGLLGRNGSGKSSLLKIIFGSLTPDYQFIAVDGRALKDVYSRRKLIHYLPQESWLPGHMKIKSIIGCFCSPVKAEQLMEHALVRPLLAQKVTQVSGGEKRIFEVLLMLYSEAVYLLLDEPFSGVSPATVEVLKNLIISHQGEKGFLITDHNYQSVLEISSVILLLDHGRTKVISERRELVELGYLPVSRQ